MPAWNQIVGRRLAPLRLPPEPVIEIIEELARRLEAAYEDALADGLSDTEAEARAVQGYDWRLLECELSRANSLNGKFAVLRSRHRSRDSDTGRRNAGLRCAAGLLVSGATGDESRSAHIFATRLSYAELEPYRA
jgi:hypothetical protein